MKVERDPVGAARCCGLTRLSRNVQESRMDTDGYGWTRMNTDGSSDPGAFGAGGQDRFLLLRTPRGVRSEESVFIRVHPWFFNFSSP
ncbi:MAG: hypothetical protein CMJ18_14400 [Phycisphaeraceae bacterium]|nr:hypothetical protein [Phycisphaeraceae bacterium]